MADQELIKLYQDQQDALGDGCGDGNCVIKKPVGMHTNGGCRCLYNLDFMGRQRVGVMLQVSQKMAGRIEELIGEQILNQAAIAIQKRKRDAAETKLAKAMDALQAAKVYIADLQDHEGAEGFSASTNQAADNYYAVLAELEGK